MDFGRWTLVAQFHNTLLPVWISLHEFMLYTMHIPPSTLRFKGGIFGSNRCYACTCEKVRFCHAVVNFVCHYGLQLGLLLGCIHTCFFWSTRLISLKNFVLDMLWSGMAARRMKDKEASRPDLSSLLGMGASKPVHIL